MVKHALAFRMLLFWEFSGSFVTLALVPARNEERCLNACLVHHFFSLYKPDFLN